MTFCPLLSSAGSGLPRRSEFLEHFETWCCRDWLAVPRSNMEVGKSLFLFEANGHWNGKITHVYIYIYLFFFNVFIYLFIYFCIYLFLCVYIYICVCVCVWGIGMGIILDTLCHMGMDQNLKSRWWFYGVKTTTVPQPRWGVHGRFVLKVPETLQRFSVSSTPSAIILAFTAGRSDAALSFNTSSIAPISTLVTWGETRSDLRVISLWHQEGRKWGPRIMMFIYVQRIFSGYTSYILPPSRYFLALPPGTITKIPWSVHDFWASSKSTNCWLSCWCSAADRFILFEFGSVQSSDPWRMDSYSHDMHCQATAMHCHTVDIRRFSREGDGMRKISLVSPCSLCTMHVMFF